MQIENQMDNNMKTAGVWGYIFVQAGLRMKSKPGFEVHF